MPSFIFYIYLFFYFPSLMCPRKGKKKKKRLFGFNKQKWPYHNDRAKTRTQMRAHNNRITFGKVDFYC